MRKLSKFIAVIAAMALVMAMSVSVFAADVSPETVPADIEADQISSGDKEVTVNDITEEAVVNLINDINGDDEEAAAAAQDILKDALAEAFAGTEYSVDETKDLNIIYTADIDIADYEAYEEIWVKTPGLEEDQAVYVFHYVEDENGGGYWEVVPAWVMYDEEGDLAVSFGFETLSPIIITVASDGSSLLVEAPVSDPEGGNVTGGDKPNTKPTSGKGTSPDTGA